MAFTINAQMAKPGPSMFYDPRFRHILEMHMPQLRTMYAVAKPLRPEQVYQFEGDFSGFLLSEGYQQEMHWLMMRVNGFTNPRQFGAGMRRNHNPTFKPYYIEPHPNALAELQQYWITLKK